MNLKLEALLKLGVTVRVAPWVLNENRGRMSRSGQVTGVEKTSTTSYMTSNI
jgi:hypothetical protein